ncbi:phosphate ABC transporter substrate-binding protein PstS [Rubrivivax sp. JA1055]|nr:MULTISPECIES: phosphate ABC transporter substrate-binding protein PstS [unclassified Rubrivivax]MCC9598083.1 phosphate ABC transporter substrate-binding protein PstS [Rubrivivax sp. JA1055]MCC9645660.1 phosphate ABC transporter substrate-binding protein PstS [Rubrivivax sp. JA1029]
MALGTSFAWAQDVTGAGASFPAPIYAKWADAYNKATGVRINYQSVGSGAGMRQIRGKTVDFGASDAPLADAELAKDGLIQFPTVIGGVVPVVNVAGIKPGQLKLTGQVLGDIYLGKVQKWNDPAIAALNPGVALPDTKIAPVRRADGSGTSFLFTNYLSKVNAEWKAKVGEGTAVNWPTGAGGKGNEGVSAFVQRLPNSIGYVEYAYAKQNKMAYVLLKNQAGSFVAPDDTAFKAAAAGADWAKSFYQVLTEQPGKDSWPITGATFIMMHKAQDKPASAAASLKFFDWAYTNGDKMAEELDYVPLPASVKDLIRKQWATELKDGAGKAIAFK